MSLKGTTLKMVNLHLHNTTVRLQTDTRVTYILGMGKRMKWWRQGLQTYPQRQFKCWQHANHIHVYTLTHTHTDIATPTHMGKTWSQVRDLKMSSEATKNITESH